MAPARSVTTPEPPRQQTRVSFWSTLDVNETSPRSPYQRWFRRTLGGSLPASVYKPYHLRRDQNTRFSPDNLNHITAAAYGNGASTDDPFIASSTENAANELAGDSADNSQTPSLSHSAATPPSASPSASPTSRKRKTDIPVTAEETERQKRRSLETDAPTTPLNKGQRGRETSSTKRARGDFTWSSWTPKQVAAMVEANKYNLPTDAELDAVLALVEEDDFIDPDNFDYAAAEDKYEKQEKERKDAVAAEHEAELEARRQKKDEDDKVVADEAAAEKEWWDKWEAERAATDEAHWARFEEAKFAEEYRQRQRPIDLSLYPDNFPPTISFTPAKGPVFDTKTEETAYYRVVWADCFRDMERDAAVLSIDEKIDQGKYVDDCDRSAGFWESERARCEANIHSTDDLVEKQYWVNYKQEVEDHIKGDSASAKAMKELVNNSRIQWRIQVDACKLAEEERIQAEKDAEEAELMERAREEEVSRQKEREPSELDLQRQKLFPFINPLNDEWDGKVDAILANTNMNKIVGKSADRVDIARKDVATVIQGSGYNSGDPPGWLNDEIVNAFYSNLVAALNTKAGYVKGPNNVPPFVVYATAWLSTVRGKGVDGIARWSGRKGMKGEKLLQCEKIFFPVNTGAHWTLMVISGKDRVIEHLDSMDHGGAPSPRKSTWCIKTARDWLQMELGSAYIPDEWKEVDRRSSLQDNGSDCGVFTCINGLALAIGMECPTEEFGAENMPAARRAIIAMLSNGGFEGDFAV